MIQTSLKKLTQIKTQRQSFENTKKAALENALRKTRNKPRISKNSHRPRIRSANCCNQET